jgi:glucose/arabinose dehydrogenase
LPSLTPSITPTIPLWTPTPVSNANRPAPFQISAADFAPTAEWSCEDFPCENDIAGFLQRIRVPAGFKLEYAGRFPGQPMHITYGRDGRLYATVLENGTRDGAIYALDTAGNAQRYSGDFVSPVGLAFQPGTDVLYVSSRVTLEKRGRLWRVPPGGGPPQPLISDLPCCYSLIDNQPNGLTFGPDGYLYLGVGSLTDHLESPTPKTKAYADLVQYEATVLRIQPHTSAVEVYASGLRNPYGLAFAPDGQLYVTDNGMVTGPFDRLVAVQRGGHYGWPYWRGRGCEDCPFPPGNVTISPDLVTFLDYTRPRGLVVYTGNQFPANLFGNVFVALWNGTLDGQRVVRIDPHDPRLGQPNYTPEPFITGLIRPTALAVAPDGSLVVADFIYGHVWRVRYLGG